MAKQQQFLDLFVKYDDDKDGQINQQQFIQLITELDVEYQYPGTVTKIIRKLNYTNPDKNTLNLQQAKEYYNSLQSPSKHEIWKAKYSLLNSAYQIKQCTNSDIAKEEGAAPSAAPGVQSYHKQEGESKPQEGHIHILVGPPKPAYISQVDIQFQKSQKPQKVKPFVKIQVTSKSQQRAKQLQTIFKQCIKIFVDIFVQEEPKYADIAKSIHINSVVNGCKTTFFITTTTEDVIQYIQTLTEFYQLAFNYQLVFQGHLKFEFDYDFEKFINEQSSSFYDICAKNCRIKLDVTILSLLKSLRKLMKAQVQHSSGDDLVDLGILTFLLHLEGVEGDFQFQNSQGQGETETKQELKQLLGQLAGFFYELNSKGIKIKQLIELLDETLSIQVNGGDWKTTLFLRLTNINKIFLQSMAAESEVDDD